MRRRVAGEVGADALAVEDEAGAEGHVGGAEDEARVVGEEVQRPFAESRAALL
jgi:hypothetical protein